MQKIITLLLISQICIGISNAQYGYWQQRVHYKMDILMDVQTNQFTGEQILQYTNNSPDTLKKVFYHLYWNAFRPGSMMDVRNRELMKSKSVLQGWDDLQKDRILYLQPDETGYQKIASLTMDGVPQKFQVDETILEVFLSTPILPHTDVTFKMNFEAQVPLQIRRSGRDNPYTGVRYSMSQWYPEMCEYDVAGWHPTPYVAREFYGVWGDFDVRITIDKGYILGGSGYLQNADKIGYGYETAGTKVTQPAGDKLTWHFTAQNVHDFMWGADTAYIHLVRHIPNGPTLHVLYVNHKRDTALDKSWNALADGIADVFPFMEQHFGKYAYQQFSVVQGGDGGMEYPMSCLVADANIGTAFHEMLHSWYQGMLGTNESLNAWMDEGFTCYAYDLVWDYYLEKLVKEHPENKRMKEIRDYFASVMPALHFNQYKRYLTLAKSGEEEALSTHADHYNSRAAYEVGVYSKGDVFLEQLGYITGAAVRDSILLEYYRLWRFKHPDAGDFIRVAEKVSGLQLDWYKEYWLYTTKTIDYEIDTITEVAGKTRVNLKMTGKVPMPLDVLIHLNDGTELLYYIPQYFMFGAKPPENNIQRTVCTPWRWTDPNYTLELPFAKKDIKDIEIDPSKRMADINRNDNKVVLGPR
ncbi:M1 family metallopeptidase [Chitinophagaceae bacterium LWZ2-11]